MGQGFSLATPSAGSAGIDIAQLQDVQYERSIGNARFMKSIRGRHENGIVLVKVLVKPYAEANLDEYKKLLIRELPPATPSRDQERPTDMPQSSARLWPTSPTPSASRESSRRRRTDTLSASSSTAHFTTG